MDRFQIILAGVLLAVVGVGTAVISSAEDTVKKQAVIMAPSLTTTFILKQPQVEMHRKAGMPVLKPDKNIDYKMRYMDIDDSIVYSMRNTIEPLQVPDRGKSLKRKFQFKVVPNNEQGKNTEVVEVLDSTAGRLGNFKADLPTSLVKTHTGNTTLRTAP